MSDHITQLRGELVDAASRRPTPRVQLAPVVAVIVVVILGVGLIALGGREPELAGSEPAAAIAWPPSAWTTST